MPPPDHPGLLRVAVACSGGRDSMALLLATVRVARHLESIPIEVWALHVNHGLSTQADQWAQHVETAASQWARRGWPVKAMVRQVVVDRDSPRGIEAAARQARYQALADMARSIGSDLVLLGHHRQDQAETVLLQALRGGSVAGLAAMPVQREWAGITWIRPWLAQPRSCIELYGRLHGLAHVDDDSNTDEVFARNRLRRQVWPTLTRAFAEAESRLADTAARLADASAVLDAWAHQHLPPEGQAEWPLHQWADWSAPLRRQSLLHWLKRETGGVPSSAQVARLADELPRLVGQGRALRWTESGWTFSLYRGALRCEASQPDRAGSRSRAQGTVQMALDGISGGGFWCFAGSPGVWEVWPVESGGVSSHTLRLLRPKIRQGGERWQSGPGRPPRSLKKQFQAAAVPAWMRRAPLLYAGDVLVLVPGLGVDSRWHGALDEPQWMARWHDHLPT